MIRGLTITHERALQVSGRSLDPIVIPDRGLLHQWDAHSMDFDDGASIFTVSDQEGSLDLSGNATGVLSGVNGLPSIDYDGESDEHTVSTSPDLGPNGEYTVLAVGEWKSSVDAAGRFFDSGDGDGVTYYESNGEYNWQHDGIDYNKYGSFESIPVIMIGTYDGSNLVVRQNSIEIINKSVSIGSNTNKFAIGSEGGKNYGAILFGEIAWYNKYYGRLERQELKDYASKKWGFSF